ncbi:MAG TPA: DNA polymerase III subunit gamma/tau, partial [Marinobacter adhaerens]|nr:DNA polymerase III subunit gamma/tau [Marinobacter adhaerens]
VTEVAAEPAQETSEVPAQPEQETESTPEPEPEMPAAPPVADEDASWLASLDAQAEAAGEYEEIYPLSDKAPVTEEPAPEVAAEPVEQPAPAPEPAFAEPDPAPESAIEAEVEQEPLPEGEFVWYRDFRSLGIVGMPGNLASHGAMSRDGDVITLTIDEGHARLLNSRHEEKILAALRNRFGDSIQLRTEQGNPGPDTPAACEERQRKARQEAAEASIHRDPVVKSIVERFEARVVEDSIRPAETSRR